MNCSLSCISFPVLPVNLSTASISDAPILKQTNYDNIANSFQLFYFMLFCIFSSMFLGTLLGHELQFIRLVDLDYLCSSLRIYILEIIRQGKWICKSFGFKF